MATFYDDQDKVYLTINIEAGAVFPALAFEDNRAFMGWAKRKGLSKGAKWQEGQSIPAKDAVYYPVITSKPKESTAGKLVEPHNHSYVYLVGDSRMKFTQDQFGKRLKRTRFIAKCGQGLLWLSHQGYQELLMAIRSDGATVKNKAVVFCLGVNDLQNVQEYVSFYRTIAPTLKALKCDLYLTSVNPFSPKQRELYKRVVTGKSEYREWRSYGQKVLLNRVLIYN